MLGGLLKPRFPHAQANPSSPHAAPSIASALYPARAAHPRCGVSRGRGSSSCFASNSGMPKAPGSLPDTPSLATAQAESTGRGESGAGAILASVANTEITQAGATGRRALSVPDGVEERFWNWRFGSRIRYLSAGSEGTPMLLLHGFGVGAHHWERNMVELAQAGHRVFAVDLIGQGSSWPEWVIGHAHQDRAAATEQLHDFILQVIGGDERVYVAGNSLGGMLAMHLGAKQPDMVRGLILLNATPFWSFRPPTTQPQGLWGVFPKNLASVPGPEGLRGFIGKYWWNNLRNPKTVRSMIQLVYAEKNAADEALVQLVYAKKNAAGEALVQKIVEATLQPGALDAFLSIVLAPKPELSFDEMLKAVSHLPILMVYGQDDPWVVPLWGQRLKRTVPAATYLELTPSG
eukprot:gene23853-9409_t